MLGTVKCLSKTRFDQVNNIPDALCYLDTGYDKANTIKILRTMYKMPDIDTKPIYGYVFGYITQFDIPAHKFESQLNLFAQ